MLITLPNCSGGGDADGDDATGALGGRSVVIVVADSLHAGHLGAYGYERATSPFLRRLASEGVRVERALSQTSWTLSSVASLFTGVVQEVHGVLNAEQQLPAKGLTTLAEMFRGAGYRTVGLVQNAVVGPHTGLGRGFDRYENMRVGELGADDILAGVVEEIAGITADRPVFLYVHFGPPHMPYDAPEPYRSRYAGGATSSAVVGSIMDCASIQAAGVSPDHADVVRLVELYDGHVAYADDLLRRVAEPLLAPEMRERFAVLFTSDHGEAFMQHGATGHGPFVYEPMVRVPWVLAAPGGLPGGAVIAGPTSQLDTLPTFAQLFDLPLPDQALDGLSLAPDLLGTSTDRSGRKLFLSSRYPARGTSAQFALVDGPWKIVARRRGLPPALFDVTDDPDELEDLAEQFPERAAAMALELAERRAEYARRSAKAGSTPLTGALLQDLEALGYGGDDSSRNR